jgi:integrase
VFRKQTTRPVPPGAETIVRKGERLARWKDRKGKTRTAPLTIGKDGSERIVTESAYFIAKYRDGAGLVQEVATGCRDETAARRVLADLERQAELVKAGVVTQAEAAAGAHQATPIEEHFGAYLAYLETAGACPEHRKERDRQLRRLARECGFRRLADLDRSRLENWLTGQTRKGMGARTRNSYLASALAFCNWCCEPNVGRLTRNPFDGTPKADERADPRRQRRAMTEAELLRLLPVARERPLLEALTVRKGPRAGERYADVRPEVRARLELLGRERALIYKTLVLTGLRKGELASLIVGQLHLAEAVPFVSLDAADEKNREGNDVPLRDDLAADLQQWLEDKLHCLQQDALRTGAPIPARLPPDTPVFDVPDKLSKILNRDLKAAAIAKRDDRGRTLDVHALRHSFGTFLSKGGVAPRTAMAAMRHSKLELTMGVYTDPALLDVRGALDALPLLPLTAGPAGDQETGRATGTYGEAPGLVAPVVAPTFDEPEQSWSTTGKMNTAKESGEGGAGIAISAAGDSKKGPLTIPVNDPLGVGATGLEPVTPSVSSKGRRNASGSAKELAERIQVA